MTSDALRPYTNSNFLVDLGFGDPRSPHDGFCEVIFPEFTFDSPEPTQAPQSELARDLPMHAAKSGYLTLRRGVTGARDLYMWWDKARRGKAPQRRIVKVQLLAADRTTIVLSWYFRQARPVSLSYSALNALQPAVLIETIELEFDSVEIR